MAELVPGRVGGPDCRIQSQGGGSCFALPGSDFSRGLHLHGLPSPWEKSLRTTEAQTAEHLRWPRVRCENAGPTGHDPKRASLAEWEVGLIQIRKIHPFLNESSGEAAGSWEEPNRVLVEVEFGRTGLKSQPATKSLWFQG